MSCLLVLREGPARRAQGARLCRCFVQQAGVPAQSFGSLPVTTDEPVTTRMDVGNGIDPPPSTLAWLLLTMPVCEGRTPLIGQRVFLRLDVEAAPVSPSAVARHRGAHQLHQLVATLHVPDTATVGACRVAGHAGTPHPERRRRRRQDAATSVLRRCCAGRWSRSGSRMPHSMSAIPPPPAAWLSRTTESIRVTLLLTATQAAAVTRSRCCPARPSASGSPCHRRTAMPPPRAGRVAGHDRVGQGQRWRRTPGCRRLGAGRRAPHDPDVPDAHVRRAWSPMFTMLEDTEPAPATERRVGSHALDDQVLPDRHPAAARAPDPQPVAAMGRGHHPPERVVPGVLGDVPDATRGDDTPIRGVHAVSQGDGRRHRGQHHRGEQRRRAIRMVVMSRDPSTLGAQWP